LEGEIRLGASWSDGINGEGQNVGGTGKYRDQPTITYAPLIGKKFSERMFSFLMLLFSFSESEKAYAPVVTIPTG
jgi:hypothetical protein